VFDRSGDGHVGSYTGEDLTSYHFLKGDQGHCVSVMRPELSLSCPALTARSRQTTVDGAMANIPLSGNEA
jgi:hypothetical protein